MRSLFIISFIFISTFALSQDQITQELQRKINRSVDEILLLHELDRISTSISVNTLCWIYMAPNETAKSDLKNTILIELSVIRENIGKATLEQEDKIILNALLVSVEDLASAARNNMNQLMVFEDYYDSTGFASENYKLCEKKIDQEILPKYHIINDSVTTVIAVEEKKLSAILNEASATIGKTKIDKELIAYRYKILSDRYKAQQIGDQLVIGSLSWVYRGHDSISKEYLLKILDADLKELIDGLNAEVENKEALDPSTNETLIQAFDTLSLKVMSITKLLDSLTDYDDGLTVLLSQDDIAYGIYPQYLGIQTTLFHALSIEIEKLRSSISEISGKKKNDIRKMLEYNFTTLQFVMNEANKTNPQFNLSDLIDEIIPIYSKRFTHDEIKEILKFQESKVGKKVRKNSSSILLETMEVTGNYYKSISNKKN